MRHSLIPALVLVAITAGASASLVDQVPAAPTVGRRALSHNQAQDDALAAALSAASVKSAAASATQAVPLKAKRQPGRHLTLAKPHKIEEAYPRSLPSPSQRERERDACLARQAAMAGVNPAEAALKNAIADNLLVPSERNLPRALNYNHDEAEAVDAAFATAQKKLQESVAEATKDN